MLHCTILLLLMLIQADTFDPRDKGIHKTGATRHDLVIVDSGRNREIPVRVYLPDTVYPAPVILYSHGLGGSRTTNQYLGIHWRENGFAVVYVQHHGSDEALLHLKGAERDRALRQAVSGKNLILRVEDISRVIDELTRWHSEDQRFSGRFDLDNIGAAGHSFGAKTVQWLAGEDTGAVDHGDKRIKAVVLLSTNLPLNRNADNAFAGATIPWLLITGTEDDSPVGALTARHRREVFKHLPAGDKYLLVLSGAGHFAFTERGPAGRAKDKKRYHMIVLEISTTFWKAWLKHDQTSRIQLKSDHPARLLAPGGVWQHK